MPSAPRSSAVASPSLLGALLSAGARGLAGLAGGMGRRDAWPAVDALDASAAAGVSRSVMDCGPGGCGGGWGGDGMMSAGGAWSVSTTPSLSRATIDELLTDELMRRIVDKMVDDLMLQRPTLAGDLGELTACVGWLDARGLWAEAQRAMTYARAYGGGGVVCFVDDGRPAHEEVDLLACRDVVGFYALPKWYLVPDGVGSGRVRAGWYGARVGRPEHYFVTPTTAFADDHARRGGALPGADRMPDDVRRLLNRSGNRFHRSRVIAWPYRPEMDMRLARWQPNWAGWGPGVVESCLAPFLARRSGALRLAAIMQSVVVNTLTISDLEHRQSNGDGGDAALRARLEFIKWCRDYMSDSLPIVATDTASEFSSLSHNVSGIDKLVEAQRRYLLDVLEYPAVVLFGDSVGGMNGGAREGELQAWSSTIAAKRASWVWTAGSFGGGLRQAALLAMACRRGPTGGQMDPTVAATWQPLVTEGGQKRAEARLKNAQARNIDALVLGLTPAALRRGDPTVAEDYPSLDFDDGPMPQVEAPGPAGAVARGEVPAVEATPGGEAGVATTPAAAAKALAEEQAGPVAAATDDAPSPPALPDDIRTEKEVAAALAMSRASFRRWAEQQGVTTHPTPAGTRGGHRYSLGEVLAAWQSAAIRRADSVIM